MKAWHDVLAKQPQCLLLPRERDFAAAIHLQHNPVEAQVVAQRADLFRDRIGGADQHTAKQRFIVGDRY